MRRKKKRQKSNNKKWYLVNYMMQPLAQWKTQTLCNRLSRRSSFKSKCNRMKRLNWRKRLLCIIILCFNNAFHSGSWSSNKRITIDYLESSIWKLMYESRRVWFSTSIMIVQSRVPERTGRLMLKGSQLRRKIRGWVPCNPRKRLRMRSHLQDLMRMIIRIRLRSKKRRM